MARVQPEAIGELEYRLLGPVEVVRCGTPVPIGSRKARALLGCLLLHAGEVVSADRLIEVLWGERPPRSAGHALQVYVARLRTALEPDRAPGAPAEVLLTRSPGYQLVAAGAQLDLHRFETLVEQGRADLAAGKPGRGAAALREGLALWRGPALADLGDEPLAAAEADRLDELRVAATEDRIEAELALGQRGELAGELTALTRAHPLRERLHGQQMVALYRSGRQAEALQVFRELGRSLDGEGLRPSPWLRDLEVAILRQAPELEAPASATRDRDGTTSAPTGEPAVAEEARAVPDPGDEAATSTPASLVRTVTAVHAAPPEAPDAETTDAEHALLADPGADAGSGPGWPSAPGSPRRSAPTGSAAPRPTSPRRGIEDLTAFVDSVGEPVSLFGEFGARGGPSPRRPAPTR